MNVNVIGHFYSSFTTLCLVASLLSLSQMFFLVSKGKSLAYASFLLLSIFRLVYNDNSAISLFEAINLLLIFRLDLGMLGYS